MFEKVMRIQFFFLFLRTFLKNNQQNVIRLKNKSTNKPYWLSGFEKTLKILEKSLKKVLTFLYREHIIVNVAGEQRTRGGRECGSLAQLGERLPYKQDVGGSIPSTPILYVAQ